MRIDYRADFGRITIEVLDQEDHVVAKSAPIEDDSLGHRVEWETGTLPQDGRPVRLRFSLENSRLYSFWSE